MPHESLPISASGLGESRRVSASAPRLGESRRSLGESRHTPRVLGAGGAYSGPARLAELKDALGCPMSPCRSPPQGSASLAESRRSLGVAYNMARRVSPNLGEVSA